MHGAVHDSCEEAMPEASASETLGMLRLRDQQEFDAAVFGFESRAPTTNAQYQMKQLREIVTAFFVVATLLPSVV